MPFPLLRFPTNFTCSLSIKYSLNPFTAACIGMGVRPFTEACLSPWRKLTPFLSKHPLPVAPQTGAICVGFGWLGLEVIGSMHSCLQWPCPIWQILSPTDVALNHLPSPSPMNLGRRSVIQMPTQSWALHSSLPFTQPLVVGFCVHCYLLKKEGASAGIIGCQNPVGPVYALRYDKAITVAPLLSRSWGKDLKAEDRTCRKWAGLNLEESSPLASFLGMLPREKSLVWAAADLAGQ